MKKRKEKKVHLEWAKVYWLQDYEVVDEMKILKEEIERLKDFKVYAFEWDVYVKAEDYKKIAIENRKLKDSNTILKKGWQVVFTLEKRIDELLEENKELRAYADNLDSENDNQAIEIESLKLHIEAKDEAYMSLLKDYEKLKESSETKEETLIKAIGDIFNKLKE